MKISNDVIDQLREVLKACIAESGSNRGKFEFSKELGIIENQLYSELVISPVQSAVDLCHDLPEDISDEVEGDLIIVDEDPYLIPFLEVV